MATKTRTRSPFQAPADSMAVLITESGVAPDEKRAYVQRDYVEFTNAEQTVVLAYHGYNSYAILVRTDLTAEDVFDAEADLFTAEDESGSFAAMRARGTFLPVIQGFKNKTTARKAAEEFLALVQDVEHPIRVALDGTFAPALTIALKSLDTERSYRVDEERARALSKIAAEAGVHPVLLALAVKEDRLTWSTPPVAPAQVMVVIKEDATGNLTERLVDEVVLASGQVEGLGRIVHQGGVPAYLLALREFHQQRSIDGILTAREALQKALQTLQSRTARLLQEVEAGQVVGSGFYDTLRLADDAERAQQAATAYAAEVKHADLPDEFLSGLLKNAYAKEADARFRYVQGDVRDSIKALAAINGMKINENRYL